jgi:hypothetical protein
MSWITVFISLGSALIVAFLSPRFAHLIWKKQKLREQRIAVAERFAKISADIYIVGNLHPRPPQQDVVGSQSLEKVSTFLEQDALLALIHVLFERKDTLASGLNLKKELQSGSRDLQSLYALRVDLLGRLFAEAFEISTEDLAHRARSANPTH